MEFKNPDAPMTRNQAWFLHRLTGENTLEWSLTVKQASDKIDELLKAKEIDKDKSVVIEKLVNPQPVKENLSIKPGQYFYASWGYDQTNVDHLVVISVSSTGKTCKCKMASTITVGNNGSQDALTPAAAYGDEFQMCVRKYQDSIILVGSYPFCQGSKRSGHFYKTEIGEIQYQTDAYHGH